MELHKTEAFRLVVGQLGEEVLWSVVPLDVMAQQFRDRLEHGVRLSGARGSMEDEIRRPGFLDESPVVLVSIDVWIGGHHVRLICRVSLGALIGVVGGVLDGERERQRLSGPAEPFQEYDSGSDGRPSCVLVGRHPVLTTGFRVPGNHVFVEPETTMFASVLLEPGIVILLRVEDPEVVPIPIRV